VKREPVLCGQALPMNAILNEHGDADDLSHGAS
jgi:hypothetical protein